jgi:hypothetical protein
MHKTADVSRLPLWAGRVKEKGSLLPGPFSLPSPWCLPGYALTQQSVKETCYGEIEIKSRNFNI